MPTETYPAGNAGGVIHDLGYRRYDGPRLGRPRIVAALAWQSFRAAFGLGRGAKAKIVPLITFAALCLPAVVNTVILSQGQASVVDYDTYVPTLRDLIMTVFVAVQAPELVSRDLRSRVLPLYFSRPIKPGDYPLAKYLGFTAACLVMLEVPLLSNQRPRLNKLAARAGRGQAVACVDPAGQQGRACAGVHGLSGAGQPFR
jgi:ABC-2 type transport system permease protein